MSIEVESENRERYKKRSVITEGSVLVSDYSMLSVTYEDSRRTESYIGRGAPILIGNNVNVVAVCGR